MKKVNLVLGFLGLCALLGFVRDGKVFATDIDVESACWYGVDPDTDDSYMTSHFSVSYSNETYQAMCVTPMRGSPSGGDNTYATKVITNPSGNAKLILKLALCAGLGEGFDTSKCNYSNSSWNRAINVIGGMGSLSTADKRFVTMHVIAGKYGAMSGVLPGVTAYTESELSMMDDGYYALTNDSSYETLNTLANNIDSWVSDDAVSGYKLVYAYPDGFLQTIVWVIPPAPANTPQPTPPRVVSPQYMTAKVAPFASVHRPPRDDAIESDYDLYSQYTYFTTGSKTIGSTLGLMSTNMIAETIGVTPYKTRANYKLGSSWSGWEPAATKKITDEGGGLTWSGVSQTYRSTYDSAYSDVCAKLRAWDTEYKVGQPGRRVSSPAGRTTYNCISVRGPQTSTLYTDAKITLSVSEGDGDATLTCATNSTTCKYYATSNTLDFKVTPTYKIEKSGAWPSYVNSLTVKANSSYSASGTLLEPTPSTDRTVRSSTGWGAVGAERSVSLSYGGSQKVCFNVGYQEGFRYNKTRSDNYIDPQTGVSSPRLFLLDTSPYPTNGYAHSCVEIYAPTTSSATFAMSGLVSAFDASVENEGTETRSADGMTYRIGKGDGFHTEFSIPQGTFRIRRTDNNEDPASAVAQYKTELIKGVFTNVPAFSIARKSSTSGFAAGTQSGTLLVTDTGNQNILVPIGTERGSRYSYAYCNYGQYDNLVDYVTYWTKTNGGADANGAKTTSGVASGGRHFDGKLAKCYAIYNPAASFTAEFSGSSLGYINPNTGVSPGITRSDSNRTAIINNSARDTSGDDGGRYHYVFDNTKSSVSYTATFTHTVSLSNSEISSWMKNESGTPYKRISTQFRVEESNDGGNTWTVLSGYSSKTTKAFSESDKSNSDTNTPSFVYYKSANWGIGKYWNYCQRLSWNKSKRFETKSVGAGYSAVATGKDYGIDNGNAGEWTSEAEMTKACVVIKNPEWKEEETSLYHKINARGYASLVGVNTPGTSDYTTGTDGVVLCSAEYALATGDDCGVSGGGYGASIQYNMLKQTASTYFSHVIRRYDNRQYGNVETFENDGARWFDEGSGVGTWATSSDGEGSFTGLAVKTSGVNKNFWKNACLKTSLEADCYKNSGVAQVNSMYAYANFNSTELSAKGLSKDPFSVEVRYKGNAWTGSFLGVSPLDAGTVNWTNGNRIAIGATNWKMVERLSKGSVGVSAEWNLATDLGNVSEAGSKDAKLNGMTWQKFGVSDIKAGETKLVCHATRTRPSEWDVRYVAISRRESYNKDGTGAMISGDGMNGLKMFNRYELRSVSPEQVGAGSGTNYDSQGKGFVVGVSAREGQDCVALKRDWNYNIVSAKLSSETESGDPIMNSGETISGSVSLNVIRDNESEVEGKDTGTVGWKNIDGSEREFITDVSGDKTKVSLVLYSLLPFEEVPEGSGLSNAEEYHEKISEVIGGGTITSNVGENYCRFFSERLGGKGLGECVDLVTVNTESAKWGNGGSLTGDWKYSDRVGVNGNDYGLRLDPTTVSHIGGTNGFSDGSRLPASGNVGAVSSALNYSLNMPIPGEIKSFKMPTGTKFCVAVAIEGKSSTSNYTLISESNCKNVVKNAQFSVWGGDVGSNGGVDTTFVQSDTKLFGSWGDFGVIANGQIKAMSSGRGLANGLSSWENDKLKDVSGLSLANQEGYGTAGASGINMNTQKSEGNGIVARLENREDTTCVREASGELDGGSVAGIVAGCGGLNRLVIKGDVIRIKGSIVLSEVGLSDSGLRGISDVPQIVIVANEIAVKEDVERIDAWLVSRGSVNTCEYKTEADGSEMHLITSGASSGNKRRLSKLDCTKFLQVNGPVVGGRILLRRTMGGDPVDNLDYETGGVREDGAWEENEGVLSENIDDGPSALLFSASVSSDNAPSVVYMRELAPRY